MLWSDNAQNGSFCLLEDFFHCKVETTLCGYLTVFQNPFVSEKPCNQREIKVCTGTDQYFI